MVVILPVATRDTQYVEDAALWLQRFYAGVTVVVRHCSVELSADDLNSDQLTRIWRTALFNERLLAQQASKRETLLTGLVE